MISCARAAIGVTQILRHAAGRRRAAICSGPLRRAVRVESCRPLPAADDRARAPAPTSVHRWCRQHAVERELARRRTQDRASLTCHALPIALHGAAALQRFVAQRAAQIRERAGGSWRACRGPCLGLACTLMRARKFARYSSTGLMSSARGVSFQARGCANCSCPLPLTAAAECFEVVARDDDALLGEHAAGRALAGGKSRAVELRGDA